ncbi:hypothetical protein B0A54_10058 [Friedmanniomyces endolithicus]|uniref:Uncharacterized protein n=1 Tax=Friedmanniomyces endolithicus TaxID=329885 RepID=A0A4U0UV75_9PEZI|nr:hypothetical protein B0A54_10058 [Friedmanniomyces endolithicus]
MDRSQERRTKRPAEYIDDTGHESKKAKRRRELWGSLPSPSGLLFERGHSPLGCCFGWQGSHSATRRPEERQTSDVSSFHLQLLDGGTTTKTRHRAPVQANIRAKIERDVGDDAERNRSDIHRMKQDPSPQAYLTANAWELRAAFLRHDLPAGGEESVPTKYLRFARNNPNLDLDPSHFDWIISALGRR